jgi:hypothetical protein
MAKDAGGHGSEARGSEGGKQGMAKVSVTRPVGYRIADIGKGGKEFNVQTGTLGARIANSPNNPANNPAVAEHMKAAIAAAAKFGPDHPEVGAAMQRAIMAARPEGGFYKISDHQTGIAAQHGVETSHLTSATHNSSGHVWGSPAALADFKSEHGGPRNHAAEAKGFASGKREINSLKRQGK